MTQPAVSAQIRRLQSLLGVELFDKSAPGVALTTVGRQVIDSARRLLSVNDEIVQMSSPAAAAQMLRVGLRKDCMGEELARILAATRAQWPNLRFSVLGAGQRRMLQYLKQDQMDLVVALVAEEPNGSARHYWTEKLVWVRGKSASVDLAAPIPLVSYGDRCVCHSIALETLEKVGLSGELVFRANTAEALRSAVAAGVGMMLAPRNRVPAELEVWDNGPLPPAPPAYGSVFVREGAGRETIEQLADRFADALRPTVADAVRLAPQRAAEGTRRSA